MAEDKSSKKVDEAWKHRVEEEKKVVGGSPELPSAGAKEVESPSHASQAPDPAPNDRPPKGKPSGQEEEAREKSDPAFLSFLSSLTLQALAALGETPHPLTQAYELDLDQAKGLIGILELLQKKTQNNRTPEESEFFEQALYELHMKFAQKAKGD